MSFTIDFQNREALSLDSQLQTGSALDWLKPSRSSALEKFQSAKAINRKVEHWKYNQMNFLSEQSFLPANSPEEKQITACRQSSKSLNLTNAIELLFIDGYLVTPLEKLKLIDGLKITPFEKANEQQQSKILSLIDPEFDAKNMLLNLAHAINQNGLLLEVEKKTQLKAPVLIRYMQTQQQKASISTQKIVVDLEQSAQASLIEFFEALPQQERQLSVQQTLINLAANAKLEHYRLNLEDESSTQISQVKTCQSQDSTLNSFYLGLGSQLNRTDIEVLLQGTNAHSELNGIYLPARQQAIDYHSNIEHQAPHCTSNEAFRGIIADQSKATFNGKIHIFQDAQKSDAYLNNKNLLLTNQAEVNTKPELEIYADDVSCAHGATVAQLDKKSLYYLQTRGIDELQAKKILSIGFIQELLNQIENAELRQFLSDLLDQHMSAIN